MQGLQGLQMQLPYGMQFQGMQQMGLPQKIG